MALDRLYSQMQNPGRDCTTSVAIHLPVPSANNHQLTTDNSAVALDGRLQLHESFHQQHSNLNETSNDIRIFTQDLPTRNETSRNQSEIDLNNNNNSDPNDHVNLNSNETIDVLDFCHHQAATRSLLPHNPPESSTSTTSDTSQAPTPPPNYHEIPGIVPAYQGRSSGPPPSYDEVVNPNAPPPSYQSLFGQAREARKTSNGLVDLFRQLLLILIGTLGCTMIIGFLLLIPITMILVGLVYVNQCRAENIPSFLVIGGLVWIVKNILNCYNQFKKDSTTSNRPPPRRVPLSSSSNIVTSSGAAINQNVSHPDSTTLTSTSGNSSNNRSSSVVLNQEQPSHTRRSISSNSTNQSPVSVSPSETQRVHVHRQNTRVLGSLVARESHIHTRIGNPSLIGITSFKCESMLNYFLIVWFLAGCIVVYRIYEPDYDNPLSASYCNRTVYQYAFWLMTSACVTMAIVLSCLCCLMVSSLMSCNHGR